jgi:hypothetical protein
MTAPPHDPRRVSLLLWLVNLCAIGASTLSYVYLSYYTYKSTGSVILSQAVLFAPMVLPVLLVSQIHQVSDRVAPRSLLVAANLVSLSSCAIVFALLASQVWLAIAGAVVVGTSDALQRVARIIAIRRYFSSADVRFTVPLTLTAQFIAGGVAGAMMSIIRGEMTPLVTLGATCLLFGAAAAAAACLPAIRGFARPVQSGPAIWSAFRALMRSDKTLSRSFWVFVAFVSVYQGFFNVSRVTLPAHVLQLSEGFVGLLQSVNSVAALLGALVYAGFNRRRHRFPPLAMAALSALFLVTAAAGVGVVTSYATYFFYIFFFELAFFRLQSDLVVNTPPERMPLIAAVQYAGVYAGMITTIFIGSVLVEQIGLMWTGVVFVAGYAAALALCPQAFRPAAQPA